MKYTLNIGILILSLLITAATVQYLFCPVYNFVEPAPFAGDSLYNPYAGIVEENWVKSNFHAHVKCWWGITNGKGSATDIRKVYSALGYGVYGISDYHASDAERDLPVNLAKSYEHGYNIGKVHQLVLGASRIHNTDWLFPQTIYNKQQTISSLSADTNALVILNHPDLRKAFNSNDVSRLSGYSCMEVINPARESVSLWDAALSAGKPVFIVGNDDLHNIFDSSQAGRICTVINVAAINKKNIINALKTGKSYTMRVDDKTVLELRRGKKIALPALQNFTLTKKLLEIKFSEVAESITLLGQHGTKLYQVSGTSEVRYSIKSTEPYVRVVATFKTGTKIYLNPVFRTRNGHLPLQSPVKDATKTSFFSAAGVVLLAAWFHFARKKIFSKKADT